MPVRALDPKAKACESSSEELPGLAVQPVVLAVSPQSHMFEADFLEAVALADALACATDQLLIHETSRLNPASTFQSQKAARPNMGIFYIISPTPVLKGQPFQEKKLLRSLPSGPKFSIFEQLLAHNRVDCPGTPGALDLVIATSAFRFSGRRLRTCHRTEKEGSDFCK